MKSVFKGKPVPVFSVPRPDLATIEIEGHWQWVTNKGVSSRHLQRVDTEHRTRIWPGDPVCVEYQSKTYSWADRKCPQYMTMAAYLDSGRSPHTRFVGVLHDEQATFFSPVSALIIVKINGIVPNRRIRNHLTNGKLLLENCAPHHSKFAETNFVCGLRADNSQTYLFPPGIACKNYKEQCP